MIYTVYLNPTIDKTVYFDGFRVGHTNRPEKVIVDGAGKAVNVSVVLKNLGLENICLGFVFRKDGDIIKERLEHSGIDYIFDEFDGSSRVNTKIFDMSCSLVTEINEDGAALASDEYSLIIERILDMPVKGDTVVMTGSLPKGADAGIYAKMITNLKKKGVFCVLDASGEALRLGVVAKPELIKPNIDELSVLTDTVVSDRAFLAERLACFAAERGIRYVALSMGKDGAMLTDGKAVCFADALKVNVMSTVGAGDSMVAGIIAGLSAGVENALRYGVAAAAASITREGTKLMKKEIFDKLSGQVNIKKIL